MTRRLRVSLDAAHVGTLILKDNGNLQFRYSLEVVSAGGPQISFAMPVRREAYPHRVCVAVFGGLLPEGLPRLAAARVVGTSSENHFRLLEAFGGDCAGALGITAGSSGDPAVPPVGSADHVPRRLTASELADVLDTLGSRPFAIDQAGGIRMSLAGAQTKLPVIIDDDGAALPTSPATPTTHIMKPEPREFPGLVANEFACMRLAAACGLDVADTELSVSASGRPVLVVRRFDRTVIGARMSRIHQEDACQALAIPPDQKYQQDGGPAFRDVGRLIRDVTTAPATSIANLWAAAVFNVLLGNCDAHGKNFSVLYDPAGTRLAPLYDLVSTSMYPALSRRLAMSVGSATMVDDVTGADVGKLAADLGLPAAAALRRARHLADLIIDRLAAPDDRLLEGADHSVLAQLRDGVQLRAARMLD